MSFLYFHFTHQFFFSFIYFLVCLLYFACVYVIQNCNIIKAKRSSLERSVEHHSKCLKRTSFSGRDPLGERSITYACVYILGIHFRVPQTLLPSHASIQVLVVFLWMYSIILTTGYSSNLTAFLTVKRQPPSIETIKELRESRLNVFGVGPFFGNSMAQSENPHLRVSVPWCCTSSFFLFLFFYAFSPFLDFFLFSFSFSYWIPSDRILEQMSVYTIVQR